MEKMNLPQVQNESERFAVDNQCSGFIYVWRIGLLFFDFR